MGEEISGVQPDSDAAAATNGPAVEQQEPLEWQTFLPAKDNTWGRHLNLSLRFAIDDTNLQGLNMDALKALRDNFDVDRFNALPVKENPELLQMFREVRHDLGRMWMRTTDPRDPSFETPEQANAAIYVIEQRLAPYLKKKL